MEPVSTSATSFGILLGALVQVTSPERASRLLRALVVREACKALRTTRSAQARASLELAVDPSPEVTLLLRVPTEAIGRMETLLRHVQAAAQRTLQDEP